MRADTDNYFVEPRTRVVLKRGLSIVRELCCYKAFLFVFSRHSNLSLPLLSEVIGQWCHWKWNCIMADANTTIERRIKIRHILRHNKHLFYWLPPFFTPQISFTWIRLVIEVSSAPIIILLALASPIYFSYFYSEREGHNPRCTLLVLLLQLLTEWPAERGTRL